MCSPQKNQALTEAGKTSGREDAINADTVPTAVSSGRQRPTGDDGKTSGRRSERKWQGVEEENV